jgi:methanethiol S-methyltransferase
MGGFLAFLYGVLAYVVFFGTFLYAIGFVGNLWVPKGIDSGAAAPLMEAVIVNVLLLGLFGMQHSVMARPAFKRWWTRFVPRPVERSTYVLAASLALILLFWQWRPLPGVVWDVEAPLGRAILWSLFGLGWFTVLISTFHISHLHLFGVRQVHECMRGKPLTDPEFRTPGLYRLVRHPIMLGFFIAFWATPAMSLGHLLFAGVSSLYILAALQFEEHDLMQAFGERYRQYRAQVPMLLPRLWRGKAGADRKPV